MPRTAGVSLRATVWRIRRNPRPRTTSAWLRLNPMGLFSNVTFTVPPFVSVRKLAMSSRARAGELLNILGPKPRDQHRILQRRQACKRRPHDVVRIRRSERLGQDVRDAGRFDDCTDSAARDDAGAVGRWLEQHPSGSEGAGDFVRNRRPLLRHPDEALLCRLDTLLDGRRDFLGLADPESDHSVAVTDDHQGAETQVLAALDDLRDPFDRDNGV